MLLNSQSFAIPAVAGIATNQFKNILSEYFNMHSSQEIEATLIMLHYTWLTGGHNEAKSHRDIANMVFAVHNLGRFLHEAQAADAFPYYISNDDTALDYVSSKLASINPITREETLQQLLQNWICPEFHSVIEPVRDEKFNFFNDLSEVIRLCDELNRTFELEGGVICA